VSPDIWNRFFERYFVVLFEKADFLMKN